jgi:fructose-bisphosphate aldolase / 2-amino-3,7-dideoxy-D-threo-hept-6-ulosonate synthase
MSLGKQYRLRRLFHPETQTTTICAIDHGMTSPVLLQGLSDMRARVAETIRGGADVIMLSKGFARIVQDSFDSRAAWAMLLSARAAMATEQQVVGIGQVEEALRLGADAVVVYVALTGPHEAAMIRFVGEVGEACDRMGMPFIAEAEYPTAYQPLSSMQSEYGADYLKRNSRLCAELGADIVKTNWTGDGESFAELVKATSVPVVLAGGPRLSDGELLERMETAVKAGGRGCSVGRNIFQHRDPEGMTRALTQVVRGHKSAAEALGELESSRRWRED